MNLYDERDIPDELNDDGEQTTKYTVPLENSEGDHE